MDEILKLNSENLNIEELLKNSKHLQNKLRQELSRQSLKSNSPAVSYREREELPPVSDKIMITPYLKNVVADHLHDRQSLSEKSLDVRTANKSQGTSARPTRTPAKKTVGLQVKEQLLDSHRLGTTVATQVEVNELRDIKNKIPKVVNKPTTQHKRIVSQRSILRQSPLKTSESYLNSNKSLTNQSVHTKRLPLQRFADTSKTNIDFNQEHPTLALDTSPGQCSLFPRRFLKQSQLRQSLKQSHASVNLAEAEIKKPKDPPVLKKQETWNGILLKNRSETKEATKVVRLRQSIPVKVIQKEVPQTNREQPKDLEIISNKMNSLYIMEKQSGKLAKQKKCHLQSFPVMYIRPECQVQRVVQISIRGDNETLSVQNSMANTKYIECKHVDDKPIEPEPPLIVPQETTTNEKESCQLYPMNDNKFFKALEFSDLPSENYQASHNSKSSESLSSSRGWVSSSSSHNSSSKKSNTVTSCRELNQVIENVIASSERVLPSFTKNVVRPPPSRREVYVQTDYECEPKPATDTTPPELTSTITVDILSTFPPTPPPPITFQKIQKQETATQDDYISKIFKRIRNDVPSAVQTFKKNLNTTYTQPTTSSVVEQFQKQIQKHHHQMSAISDASNVELPPNEIEPRLARVQGKGQENIHTILQMSPVVDGNALKECPLESEDEESVEEGNRNFVLLQQNPLFVQTINRIESSAVVDAMPGKNDERIKRDRHEYPKDAEIKRAVKIFIDSLTLDGTDWGGGRGGGGGDSDSDGDGYVVGIGASRKSIPNDDVRKKMKSLTRLELINTDRLWKYTNSDSSRTSNRLSRSSSSSSSSSITSGGTYVKSKSNTRRGCGVSDSSSFTRLSLSDTDSENEDTKDMHHRLSLNESNESCLSDGEVLSIGEVKKL